MTQSRIYIIILLILFAFNSQGQLYNYQHLSVENGLPQANADALIQDHQHFVWIGTQVGAVRFDGKNYLVFSEKDGLSNHIVNNLFESSDKELWIGTKNGLNIKKHDTIISYYQKDGLPHNEIKHIWEGKYKKIWVMTESGLVYFQNEKFHKVKLPDPNQIIKNHCYYNDTLYLATNKGVLIQTGEHTFKSILPNLKQYNIDHIILQNDTIWVATFGNGLIKISKKRTQYFNNNSVLNSNVITSLLLDKSDRLWIGTEGNGFFLRKNKTFQSFTDKNGMHNTSILSLMEDIEGNIWAGGRNGVIIYNPNNPFMHYSEANQGTQESLFGMLQDKNGVYWFTTYGAGLSKFDNDKWTYYSKEDGLKDNRLFKIIEDKNQNKWIASSGHGIIKFDGKKFLVYDANNGFFNSRVFSIFLDSKQNLWGCSSEHGPFKYDGSKFITYGDGEKIPNTIMSCIEDTLGQIWFGSVGNGLIIFDGSKFITPELEGNIQPTYIRSLAIDSTGILWMGTSSEGVCKVIKTGENKYKLISISTENGLNSNNIYFVLADNKNQIWAGTEKGINKIRLNQNQKVISIQTYGRSEGFIGAETSINGAMLDRNGKVWFSSLKGATVYDPMVEKKNLIEPNTQIIQLKLFYQKVDWSKYTDTINNDNLPINIKLPFKQNHITFEFIGLSFTNPQKVRYQYKLSGIDRAWSPITKNTEAVYSNIPPGQYTFKVKSCNNDGVWNQKPTSYPFEILAPFWQKAWFYVLVALTIGAVIFIYIRLRLLNLNKAKLILEQKVTQRTSEIELKKKEIQEKNEELNQRTEEIAAQRDELNEQNIKMEKLYQEQTESIKYAKHIQNAVLSSIEPLQKFFNDYFIIFNPHSIVSGDFYYVAEVQEWVIIAAADSTGHGVPGGFMSMLGMSFLNEIVYPMKDIQTNIILNKLRTYIIKSLKQKGTLGEHKEGMEMSITAIHKSTYECQFSGARNPVLLVRADNNPALNFEIIRKDEQKSMYLLPPNNMPISIYPKMNPFAQQKLNLCKGDKLYYFSDGYADQFGGGDRKKLSKKTFYEIIFKTSNLNIAQQKKELQSFYDQWRGSNEKIDDVLVIGIEV